jgi:hypothetical protein
MSENIDITPILGVAVVCPEIGKCRCGGRTTIVGEGKAQHAASLRCEGCDGWRKWLRTSVVSAMVATAKTFGKPTEPVVIRHLEETVAATSGASAATDHRCAHNERKAPMSLGFNFNGGGADIVPFLKYDARAGRIFRNDRKEVGGKYTNTAADITSTFKAIFDFENAEKGWIKLEAGKAPEFEVTDLGHPMPPEPPKELGFKQGARIMVKLDKICGDDVRELSSNSLSFLRGFQNLHSAYERGMAANAGLLPIVVLKTTEPITSGSGEKRSTNYMPCFEIVGWATRPGDLKPYKKSCDCAEEDPT